MRGGDDTCMLDRAPILLGTCGDLTRVGEQSVGVAAVRAVHLFDRVQVRQLVPVHHEIARTRHHCDPVDRKAHPLIQGDPHVQHKQGHDQRVNDRSGQKIENAALSYECWYALPEPSMSELSFAIEPDATAVAGHLGRSPAPPADGQPYIKE